MGTRGFGPFEDDTAAEGDAALGDVEPAVRPADLAPTAEEEHHATVTNADATSTPAWQRFDSRFRVWFFSERAADQWVLRAVDDITDGEVTDAFFHADEQMQPGERFAISLVVDDADAGARDDTSLGHVWLVGMDPRDAGDDEGDRMRVRRMRTRAAWAWGDEAVAGPDHPTADA